MSPSAWLPASTRGAPVSLALGAAVRGRVGSAAGPGRHGLPSLGKSLSRCGKPVTSHPRYRVEWGGANGPFRIAMRVAGGSASEVGAWRCGLRSAAGPDRHGLPSLGKSLSRCGKPVTSHPRYRVEWGSANEPFRLAMQLDAGSAVVRLPLGIVRRMGQRHSGGCHSAGRIASNGAFGPPRRQGRSGGGTAQVRRAHKDFLSEADLCRRPAAVNSRSGAGRRVLGAAVRGRPRWRPQASPPARTQRRGDGTGSPSA